MRRGERLRSENNSLQVALARLQTSSRPRASDHEGVISTAALVLLGAAAAFVAAMTTFDQLLAR